jgi:hypothetical protein
MEPFEIISEITEIETIAIDRSIDELARLRKEWGMAAGENSKVLL